MVRLNNEYMNNYFELEYEKTSIDIDKAWVDGLFEKILKCRHRTNDQTGHQLFYSEDPKEIYEYFKTIKIVKVRIDFEAVKFEDGKWDNTWWDRCGIYIQLKPQKKRKKKYKKLPTNKIERADHQHLNIKGQKNIGKWG